MAVVNFLITNGGTHSAENWTDHILAELVPFLDDQGNLTQNPSNDVMFRVAQARLKLRPSVVEAVELLRSHEQRAFDSFNSDERVLLTKAVRGMHGVEHAPHVDDVLHFNRVSKGKVRHADDWLSDCVNKICRSAVECEGDKPPSNQMVDNVYLVLKKYFQSIQLAERSHHITSRNL